jgi:hypothetical protein
MQGSGDQNLELFDAGSRVGHLVSQGSVYAFLAEHRRRLFRGDMFADLFRSQRGRPSVPGDVITTVMVLQSLEGLSDRDAVDSFRSAPLIPPAAIPALRDSSVAREPDCSSRSRNPEQLDARRHESVYSSA